MISGGVTLPLLFPFPSTQLFALQSQALAVHLLAARADVEQLGERKQSPLMMAAAAGNLEMCRKLLEAPGTVDLWGFMGIYGDLWGFNGDLMVIYGDLCGFMWIYGGCAQIFFDSLAPGKLTC